MALDEKLIRKKLEIHFNKDEKMINQYIKVYGLVIDMNHVQEIKNLLKKPAIYEVASDKDDPTFQIRVKCPVCSEEGLFCYELKSKCQNITHDRFMTPRYQGINGFRTINYSTIAVTVCPKCLFASPDKKDFITHAPQTNAETKSQLSNYVLDDLKKKTEERKAMLDKVTDLTAYFKYPRPIENAIMSYRLALHRAQIEAAFESPMAWFKSGMATLKIAMLLREDKRKDDEYIPLAAKYFEESYKRSEFQNSDMEFQILYLVIALNLRLNNLPPCQAFLGALDKVKSDKIAQNKVDPEVKIAAVEKWADMAKNLYADRENPELWDH